MKPVHYSAIVLSLAAVTSLSLATSAPPKKLGKHVGTAPAVAEGARTENPAAQPKITGLGATGAQVFDLDLSEIGAPNLTVETVKRLKVGNHVTIPLPDGGALDYVVSSRTWTAANEQQVHLKGGASANTTYGIISQVGSRLTGFFQRRDGVSYALVPTEQGWSRVVQRPDYGDLECGVDRVMPQGLHALQQPIQPEGGIAGAVTPCPPEVTPLEIPVGLKKDSGILIDVLFVFSVDANDYIENQGFTAYDQAVLTVAQANTALRYSADQLAVEFDGATGIGDNRLNDSCGYGGPYATGPQLNGLIDAPGAADGPFNCKEDAENRAEHLAKAGVDPVESDVCTPRIRLVGALVCDGFFGAEEPFVSTGQPVDLGRLQDPTDGILDYVPGWRDALGADAVALVGDGYAETSGFLGLASVMVDANNQDQRDSRLSLPANPHPVVDEVIVGPGGTGNVSTLQAFSERPHCLLDVTILGDLVYAHELGHNMGCQHNHENGSQTEDALFPDSFGFRDEEPTGFKTVMSYGGQTRLPGYSNPRKTWDNFAERGDPGDGNQGVAGKAFDFDCAVLDETGTDANFNPITGVQGPAPTAACTEEGDDDPNDPAVMLVGRGPDDEPAEAVLEDNGKEAANNARSISQIKFDFAKFRCSIFAPVDCNNNLIDDFVESLDGTNEDCDQDGDPDACQTAVEDPGIPSPFDCNQNEIPDTCDIRDGNSQDVNQNGLPDECEDSTLLFRETFETAAYGFHDSALPICKVAPLVLAEIRTTDPEFPDYFATIESTDHFPDPNDGGFICGPFVPGLFQYALGENGDMTMRNVLGQGFAKTFGTHAYGQALQFNSATGDFPSQNGITEILLARPCVQARFYMNAADFETYFAFDPPLPGLANHAYLLENLVVVEAISIDPVTGIETIVAQVFHDLRDVQTPQVGNAFRLVTIQGQAGGTPISFDKVVIRGAFVVLDNLSFDRGQVFDPCDADIAGGPPVQGLPVPDGRVGAEDLLLVLVQFGAVVDPADPLSVIADINDDLVVDSFDLVELLSSWGTCLGG